MRVEMLGWVRVYDVVRVRLGFVMGVLEFGEGRTRVCQGRVGGVICWFSENEMETEEWFIRVSTAGTVVR